MQRLNEKESESKIMLDLSKKVLEVLGISGMIGLDYKGKINFEINTNGDLKVTDCKLSTERRFR